MFFKVINNLLLKFLAYFHGRFFSPTGFHAVPDSGFPGQLHTDGA